MKGERLEGLDIWRVALMLGGALVHGSFLQEDRPLFVAIGLISGAFRMGAFFAISGLLAALSLSRRPRAAWRERRDVEIGVPALFGLIVLCPAVQLLIAIHRTGTIAGFPLSFEMHHLWFLVALLLYTRVGCGLDVLDGRYRLLDRLDAVVDRRRSAAAWLLLATGAAIFVPMLLVGWLLRAVPGLSLALNVWHFQQIIGYAPMFLFGMALARAPRLRLAMLQVTRLPIMILSGFGCLYLLWSFGLVAPPSPAVEGVLHIAGAAFCPPAAAILILRSALAMRGAPPLVRSVCAASFTIYMLHFPIAVGLNIALSHVDANVYLEYAAVVIGSVAASYWLHRACVARVPVLSALLNGRWQPALAA